jgi:hypothetical protein
MALDRQFDDLCELYDQKSDNELFALHEQRDGLTEVAQQALAQVISERKLNPPSAPPAAAFVPDEDASESAALASDEVCVFTFNDSFSATEALRLLDETEFEHRMVNWDELSPRTEPGGPPLRLGLVVRRQNLAEAKQLLQEKMNLFPQAEGTDAFDLAGLMSVGIFERADALLVAHALGSAGVSYVWTDGDDVHIEVNGARVEQAQEIAQKALPEPEE